MSKNIRFTVTAFVICLVVFSALCVTLYLLDSKSPVIESVKLYSEKAIKLPFAISRWLDVLFGSLFFTVLAAMLFDSETKKSKAVFWGAIIGFFVGLTTNLILILSYSLLGTVFKGLFIEIIVFSLLVLLVYILFEKETKNFTKGLVSGIITGSVSGVGFVISFALIFFTVIFVVLALGLVFGIGFLIMAGIFNSSWGNE